MSIAGASDTAMKNDASAHIGVLASGDWDIFF